jgi:hypothetical protein
MTRTENETLDMHYSNDQDLYHCVLAYAAWCLNRIPSMSNQTLGRNVRDNLERWASEGKVTRLGWGPDHYPKVSFTVLRGMGSEVDWRLIKDPELGADVRESLGVEGLASHQYMSSETFVWYLRRGEDGKGW